MRRWSLILLLALVATNVLAQVSDLSAQQQVEQIRLQLLQNNVELARIQAEAERVLQARERMRANAEQVQRIQLLNEQIERRNADVAKVAKKAEEAADDLREEMNLASVRSADTAYMVIAIGLPVLLGIFVAKKTAKEGSMKYEQKFGVVLMVFALLLAILAIAISDGWSHRFDALQNVMLWLHVRFIPEYDSEYAPRMIDIPTKYVLTMLAAFFAYGFTTYLGITPAWKRAAKVAQSQEAPSGN